MRHRKALAVCAVVAAVLVGGVSTLRTLFSPERSAKRFFENYMSGDWAAVYQEIDLPEGEMLDEAHFLQVAEAWVHSEYLDYQMERLARRTGTVSILVIVLHTPPQEARHLPNWM